jgi:hypothetical protein
MTSRMPYCVEFPDSPGRPNPDNDLAMRLESTVGYLHVGML